MDPTAPFPVPPRNYPPPSAASLPLTSRPRWVTIPLSQSRAYISPDPLPRTPGFDHGVYQSAWVQTTPHPTGLPLSSSADTKIDPNIVATADRGKYSVPSPSTSHRQNYAGGRYPGPEDERQFGWTNDAFYYPVLPSPPRDTPQKKLDGKQTTFLTKLYGCVAFLTFTARADG